jgi:hypothetical protein
VNLVKNILEEDPGALQGAERGSVRRASLQPRLRSTSQIPALRQLVDQVFLVRRQIR